MRRAAVGRGWAAVTGVMVAMAAAPGAADAPGARVILEERFDSPRAMPVVATYDKVSAEMQARIERGERWHVIVGPGSRAAAQVVGGVAVVRIERAGLQSYAVQFACLPVPLQPSRAYRVSFRARAERDVFTTFHVSRVGQGWKSYSGKKELDLGRAWREYEVRFATGAADRDERARLEFDFGDESDVAVLIDDVRVVEEPLPQKG